MQKQSYLNHNFSFGPIWTHKIKAKAKYIRISNIIHPLCTAGPAPHALILWCALPCGKHLVHRLISMNFTHFHPHGNSTMKLPLLELPEVFSGNSTRCRVRDMTSEIFAIISDGNFSSQLVLGNLSRIS